MTSPKLRGLAVLVSAAALLVGGCGHGSGPSKAGQAVAGSTNAAPATSGSSASNPANPGATTPAPGATHVVSATWEDRDHDGAISENDAIVVKFSSEVRLSGASPSDFALPVSGDRFGQAASVTSSALPTDVAIVLGKGAVLTIPGTFSAKVLKPGSPSGIDLAFGATSIADLHGKAAVASKAVDVAAVGTATGGGTTGRTGGTGSTGAGGTTAGAFALLSADFADVNSSGTIDQFDTITLRFSDDVVLGTGADAPKAADFTLPVAGDTLGIAAYVQAGKRASEVQIVLGVNPVLTFGTFDKTKTTAGSASGIAPAATLTAKKLASKNGGKAVPATPVGVKGALGAPAGPILVGADYKDVNGNGKVDAGDTIILHFNKSVNVSNWGPSGAIPPSAILLPVAGDTIGANATIDTAWSAGPKDVQVTINDAAVLNPNGTFDPTVTAAGSPSGIGLTASLPKGSITDNSGKDAMTGVVVDLNGTLVAPKPPVVVSAFWVDRDLDGTASAGDWVVVELDQPVTVDASKAKASDFALPVSGDSFGQGATVQQGTNPTEVAIVLGASPQLTIKGSYSPSTLTAGSPSGIDAAASPTPGAVTSLKGVDMAPATVAWDVQAPLGALDVAMSNDTVKDAAATSAEWNQGGSGKVVGSRTFDVGAGTDVLAIDHDLTIDTDQGTLDGSPCAAFGGAGVFAFKTIQVNKGVTVTVTGRSPLVLQATDTATVDGTFLLDGMKGNDQTTSLAGSVGMGGLGGPGGFDGASGATGGLGNVAAGPRGKGPCGGLGGGTDIHAGGAGGAGFATAGARGDDGTTNSTGPGGKGGLGGPQASAARLQLVPLAGGSGGGGGGALQRPTPTTPVSYGNGTAPGAGGGGGGGAFRLVAGGLVRFGGKVSANGGAGGDGGGLTGGGAGGGGAGGSILIQSNASVMVNPSATLSARGGAGGKGTKGGDGSDGVILVEATGQVQQPSASVTGTVTPAASEAVVSASLDVGAGTQDLAIARSSVLDTDKGTLDGTSVAGFKGAGVFEVANFSVASGATLALAGGSPLLVKATGSVDVSGTIDLSGKAGAPAVGLNGGLGGSGRAGGANGGNGGSFALGPNQTVTSQTAPTSGGGPGAGLGAQNGDTAGGGGGSFGTDGANGLGSGSTGNAGALYGTSDLATLAGGSGGGGGAANTLTGQFDGGAGGGAGGGGIAIQARGDVSVSGAILANGGSAGDTPRGGNGGAGSGGAIAVRSLGRISVAGSLSAIGGDGLKNGGAGGNGRVRLEDSVGSFQPGVILPALAKGSFGTSVAVSTWVRVQASGAPATAPRYLAVLAHGSMTGAAAYAVEVEGAKDAGGTPDLTTRTGFTTDPVLLSGKEFLRFRVTLKLDPAASAPPSVDRVFVPFK